MKLLALRSLWVLMTVFFAGPLLAVTINQFEGSYEGNMKARSSAVI